MKRGQRGIELREAHFPSRAPIDAYGNGGFRFADMSHKGSVICLPSGIYGWNVTVPGDLVPKAFEALSGESETVELFLLGTGADLVPVPLAVRSLFKDLGIRVDTMSTGAAVRTFNVMLAEDRAVAAGFLAV